jgi:hypothetical protein
LIGILGQALQPELLGVGEDLRVDFLLCLNYK